MSAHQTHWLGSEWFPSLMKAEHTSDTLKQPCWHRDPYFREGSKQVIILGISIPNSIPSLFSDLKVNLIHIWGGETLLALSTRRALTSAGEEIRLKYHF